jgi:hypothetical protein
LLGFHDFAETKIVPCDPGSLNPIPILKKHKHLTGYLIGTLFVLVKFDWDPANNEWLADSTWKRNAGLIEEDIVWVRVSEGFSWS